MIDLRLRTGPTDARNLLISILCVCSIFLGGIDPLNAAEVETMEARPGGSFEAHVFQAENAKATVLMFEGGGGVFKWNGQGFINENYKSFVEKNLNVIIMTPPADRQGFMGGMPPQFREKKAHVHDVGAVLRRFVAKLQKPVWLLGISIGTKSVAAFAESQPDRIAGFVFLSSTMRPPGGYKAVTDHDLTRIRGAVLAVAHKDDECRGTPPEGAKEIVAAASNARITKLLMMSGGSNNGRNPCGIKTHHVFAGIEDEVVDEVAKFIVENSSIRPSARQQDNAPVASRRLTPEQIKELVFGKTLTFIAPSNGRQLKVYFAPDGGLQMVGENNPNRVIRKIWFVNQKGLLCRKVGRQNRDHCTIIKKVGVRKLHLSDPKAGFSYDATVADGVALGR